MALKWEPRGDDNWALFSGTVYVGFVGRREELAAASLVDRVGPGFIWQLMALHGRRGKRRADAKRALAAAWARWCGQANLIDDHYSKGGA